MRFRRTFTERLASSFVFLVTIMSAATATQPAPSTAQAVRALTCNGPVVLTNVRVIDGTGSPARENQVVVIRDGRIDAFGTKEKIAIPANSCVKDLAGRSVLPGLVMLHEHLQYNYQSQSDLLAGGSALGLTHPQHFSFPRLYLSAGVTTIRTAGTDHPYADINLKRLIDTGKTPGPEIHLTSPFLSGAGDPFLPAVQIKDVDAARRAVRYWAAEGVTSFKVYKWIPAVALAAVIDEAHKLGLIVTAHLGRGGVTCRAAAEMGIDNLEHGFGPCIAADELESDLSGPRTTALLRTLLEKRVVLTLTMDRRGEPLSELAGELLDPSARERYLKNLSSRPAAASTAPDRQPPLSERLLLAFVKGGGRIVVGTDAGCCGGGNQIAGLASHRPVEGLVAMGFAPLEAIRLATLGGATFLGIDKRTGSIEPGKEADLMIVRGDPAERIQDLNNVETVFANGVAYDPKALASSVKGQVGWR